MNLATPWRGGSKIPPEHLFDSFSGDRQPRSVKPNNVGICTRIKIRHKRGRRLAGVNNKLTGLAARNKRGPGGRLGAHGRRKAGDA